MATAPAEAPPRRPAPPPRRRVRSPTVLQMEAVECGAASLAMVLAHHGRIVPLEELRLECGVSRDGSKAGNLLKAARRYGLVARAFRCEEVEKLYGQKFPCILFWNLNHFVVLDGFGKDCAFVNDPAQGPRQVGLDEFDEAFSGVLLTFEPGPEFQPGGRRPSALRGLGARLSGSTAALAYVALCGLLLVVPGLVVPTFTRVFIDEYLVAGRGSIVRPLLVAMTGSALVLALLTWLQGHHLLRLQAKLALLHSSRLFAHLQRLPMAFFAQRYAGELGARVALNDRVAEAVASRLTSTLIDLCVVVFYFGLMLWYDVPLTLTVLLFAGLNLGVLRLARRRRADASRRLLLDHGKLMGTSMGGLQMIETLKATGGEAEFFARWSGFQAKALRGQQALSVVSETTSSVPPLVGSLATMAIFVLGGLQVMRGRMTLGMLVAYQGLAASFTMPLARLVNFGGQLEELGADLIRLDDVLQQPPDPQLAAGAAAPPAGEASPLRLSGKVELRHVTFGYSPLEAPLIEDFSLVVEPGQRVALVGASGSGKSTVARLVSGLYEPWSGEVLFDDKLRREWPRALLANSLAVVDQEVFLFGGTLTENVSMWDATLPAARVAAACRDAALAELVESRDRGYDTAIEEGGRNLSGGQRQRLEIARALAAEPSIVVLDEATSALDPATETVIDDSLRRRGCTCLIIAHRLSTIRDADRILVMQRGRVVQQGTHESMKDVEGPYRDLIALA